MPKQNEGMKKVLLLALTLAVITVVVDAQKPDLEEVRALTEQGNARAQFNPGQRSEPSAGSALHSDGDRFVLAQNAGVADAEGGVSEAYRVILVQNFFEELKARVPN